jgi:hypothetical protein
MKEIIMRTSLLGLVALLFSLSVLANTTDSREFTYAGSRSIEEFVLQAEKTRTEYRTEQVPRTCYRTVLAGYRTECRSVPYRVCHNQPPQCRNVRQPDGSMRRACTPARQACQTRYRTECRQVPVYRQEPYTCYETVRVPYQVFDRHVEANVVVILSDTQVSSISEQFTLELTGNDLKLALKGSGKVLAISQKNIRNEMLEGKEVIFAEFRVSFVDAIQVNNSFNRGIGQLSVDAFEIIANIPQGVDKSLLGVHLSIEKKKTLARNDVVIRRQLQLNEFELTDRSNLERKLSIDLARLNAGLGSGRYEMKMRLFLNMNSVDILNRSQFPNLSTESGQKFRIKKNGQVVIK